MISSPRQCGSQQTRLAANDFRQAIGEIYRPIYKVTPAAVTPRWITVVSGIAPLRMDALYPYKYSAVQGHMFRGRRFAVVVTGFRACPRDDRGHTTELYPEARPMRFNMAAESNPACADGLLPPP